MRTDAPESPLRRILRGTVAFLIALLAASAVLPSALAQSETPQLSIGVRLFPDGWADVELSVNVTAEEAFVALPLMGDPEALMVVDEANAPLNYSLGDGSILVASLGSRRVTAYYQTPSLTEKVGGVWNVTVSPNVTSRITITLPNGSTVVGLSDVPERVASEGGGVTLAFVSDSVWVSYVVPPPPSLGPGGGAGQTAPGPTAGTPRGIPWAAPASALALAAGVGIAILLRSRRRPAAAGGLDSTDEAILEGLARLGGEAYQADLVRSLGLPRSTVWRRVRRLAEGGYVELREGERGKLVRLRRAG